MESSIFWLELWVDLSFSTSHKQLSGGTANVYAGQPLDTVKVKVQTFPHLYKNWVVCLKDTYKLDGIRGLYAGTIPALTANIAENAILFAAYGYCQKASSSLNLTDNLI